MDPKSVREIVSEDAYETKRSALDRFNSISNEIRASNKKYLKGKPIVDEGDPRVKQLISNTENLLGEYSDKLLTDIKRIDEIAKGLDENNLILFELFSSMKDMYSYYKKKYKIVFSKGFEQTISISAPKEATDIISFWKAAIKKHPASTCEKLEEKLQTLKEKSDTKPDEIEKIEKEIETLNDKIERASLEYEEGVRRIIERNTKSVITFEAIADAENYKVQFDGFNFVPVELKEKNAQNALEKLFSRGLPSLLYGQFHFRGYKTEINKVKEFLSEKKIGYKEIDINEHFADLELYPKDYIYLIMEAYPALKITGLCTSGWRVYVVYSESGYTTFTLAQDAGRFDPKCEGGPGAWPSEHGYDMLGEISASFVWTQTGDTEYVSYSFPYNAWWNNFNTCLICENQVLYKNEHIFRKDEVIKSNAQKTINTIIAKYVPYDKGVDFRRLKEGDTVFLVNYEYQIYNEIYNKLNAYCKIGKLWIDIYEHDKEIIILDFLKRDPLGLKAQVTSIKQSNSFFLNGDYEISISIREE